MRYLSAFVWLTLFLVSAGLTLPTLAQGPVATPPAQPNFDPADVYYQAWLFVREAETLQKQGRHAEALNKLRSAEKFFDTIHRFHPQWKKDMVGDRLALTKNQITKVLPLAQAAQQKQEIAVAEIIESGGDRRPVAPMNPSRKDPVIEVADNKIKALESEVAQLRGALSSNTSQNSREAVRARDLEKQRDELNARLKQATAELDATRAKLAAQPAPSPKSTTPDPSMVAAQATIKAMEAEVQRLRAALATNTNLNSRDAARASDLEKQRDELNALLQQTTAVLNARLKQATAEIDAMRAKLAQKPSTPQNLTTPDPAMVAAQATIKTMEAEVQRLRAALATNANQNSRDAARASDLEKQRDELNARLQQNTAILNARLKQATAELDSMRAQLSARPTAPTNPVMPDPAAGIAEAKVKAMEAEVQRLRTALSTSANQNSRDAARASDLEKQRDELNARLQQSVAQLDAMRAKLATAPVQSEMDRLNERLRSLEQERQAMGLAFSQSREQQMQTEAKMLTLQTDYQVMSQQAADLQRNLGLEREKANEVTKAQLQQLQQLEQTLKQKDGEIAVANRRVSALEKQLKESQDAYQELRTEHQELLTQRDHMAALLKLNDNGRIQQLIEQNMGLAKELREAKERVERISKNNDETNDQLAEALRDLAITKTKIIALQTEKRAQDLRLADLEKQLQNNEKALASGDAAASKEEAETLREIIKRQLRVQERRKQAAQLLLQVAKKQVDSGDENYDDALALLTDQEVTLTPEEQKLIDARKVDGEIYSPYAGSRARVTAATTEMHQQIENYTKAAVRAFGSQRLSASREVLEMILDLHPGHVPTMTKLGIVQLRLNDPEAASQVLRAAVENDETRAISHRLLGLALYKTGDLAGAELSLMRSLEIDPNDPASLTIYGNTLLRMNRTQESELAYQRAISLNPQSAEALHNLALLCQRAGRTKEARGYYDEALIHGAPPNPDLDAALRKR